MTDRASIDAPVPAPESAPFRRRGLVYLPASSPDFTPIEQAFSKLTTFLSRTAARTREALDEAITAALVTVTATDATGWFTACGYPLKTGQ